MSKVEEGDYGVVYIEKGKHRGKLGFYDDDDVDGIIVYPSTPFATDYIIVKRSSVRQATEEEAKEWDRTHNSGPVFEKNWEKYTKQIRGE